MSPVNFQDFRNIADTRRDATISVSHSTGNLQIKDNHVLNRLITWVRNKISPNPSRQYIEREAAYNKFLGAIGNEIRYRDQLGWVEDQLGADVSLNQPLSSRRVRDILHQLDTRTTEAHRNSRVTAHYMAGMEGSSYLSKTLQEKIDARPMLQEAQFELGHQEQEELAQNIQDAVMDASADGRNDIGFTEGNRIAGHLVDGVLDKHEARLIEEKLAAERAAQEAAQRAREAAAASAGVSGVVKQDGAQQGAAASAAAENKPVGMAKKLYSKITGKTSGKDSPPQVQKLLADLKKLDLPSAVKADLKKSIKEGNIKTFGALVKHSNEKTFSWLCENRFGRWYYDGLKKSGVAVGNEVEVSPELVDLVKQTISRNPYLVEYPDVKVNVRKEIATYIAGNGTIPAN